LRFNNPNVRIVELDCIVDLTAFPKICLFLALKFIFDVCTFLFDSDMVNLAVIGAGIGGCSAAYFASKYLPGINITIYDAQDRIGGRILTCNAAGAPLDLGASFFNSFNKTLSNIIKAQGLKITPVERKDFGVWNGSEFIFKSGKLSSTTNLKLMAEYKLSLARTLLLLRKTKGQVNKLYQEELKNPADIGEIFESAGLGKWHKKPLLDFLIERGVSQAFIDEMVTPITRAIYSQNADLGGFAGISSLIGVYSGTTYRLADGNGTLPIHFAEASKATINLGRKVDRIEKNSQGSYQVYSGEDMAVFENVIIAAPLEIANIELDGLSMHEWAPQPYQTVYKRVVRGVSDPNYFGLKSASEPPAIVLTTKDADPITLYSIQKASDSESLVTISSTKPLNDKALNGIFKNGGVTVLEHTWKAAYPVFKPVTKLPKTRLDKRLMYISALEPSVSSMETSALSALNAIKMLRSKENTIPN
jgi:prenylcysteine oxidase/farnesylcysteine lyase